MKPTSTVDAPALRAHPPTMETRQSSDKQNCLRPAEKPLIGFMNLYSALRFAVKETSISLLINTIAGRPVKNDEMQGGRILRNEAYNQYAAMTKDKAQRRRSRFSTA